MKPQVDVRVAPGSHDKEKTGIKLSIFFLSKCFEFDPQIDVIMQSINNLGIKNVWLQD